MTPILAKRRTGTPLSEAELEQRRAAAHARWAAIGAGSAAAAGAGLLAHNKIGQERAAAAAAIRAHRTVIAAAELANGRRATRHDLKSFLLRENLKPHEGKAFVDHAIRTSSSQHRRAQANTRTQFDEHAVDRVMGDGTAVRVVPEEVGIDGLVAREQHLSDRLADLRANGRGARRVAVAAGTAHPVTAHQRTVKGKRVGAWEAGADDMFAHLRQQLGLPPATGHTPTSDIDELPPTRRRASGPQALRNRKEWHKAVVEQILSPAPDDIMGGNYADADQVRDYLKRHDSLDRIASNLKDMPAGDRAAFLESHGLPKMVYTRPPKTVDVPGVAARSKRAHSLKLQGYPDRVTRRSLSEELTRDVDRRATDWKAAEHVRADARVAGARAFARVRAKDAIKRLALLRNARTRFGLVAGAAGLAGAGAGLATWFAAKPKVEKLTKAEEEARDHNGRWIAGGAATAAAAIGTALLFGLSRRRGLSPSQLRAAHRMARASGDFIVHRGSPSNLSRTASDLGGLYVSPSKSVADNYAHFKQADVRSPYRGGRVTSFRVPRAGLLDIDNPEHREKVGAFLRRNAQRSRFQQFLAGAHTPEGAELREHTAFSAQSQQAAREGDTSARAIRRNQAQQIRKWRAAVRGGSYSTGEDKLSQLISSEMNYPSAAFRQWLKDNGHTGFIDRGTGLSGNMTGKARQRVVQAFLLDPKNAKPLGHMRANPKRAVVEKLAKAFGDANAAGHFAELDDKPRVTMLIGKPGSGKSTWRHIGMARDAVRPTTVVSTDDLVEDVGRQYGVGFSEAFKLLDQRKAARAQRAQIKAAVAAGHDIIIDKVNASPAGRAKSLRGIPTRYERHAVVFTVPEDELRRRRALRPGKVIPQTALREMNEKWTLPTRGEFDVVHHVDQRSKLGKAAPLESTPSVADIDPAEDALSRRLAALFGKWTDEAENRIMQPTATTMHADMIDGLDHAMKPLDPVVRAGVTAPIPVETGDGGQNIAFSMRVRSPDVAKYVDQYRQSRIVQLADEQKATIKGQLIDAAMSGASPQTMASRIKQTIGLTPFQAGHVVNYQAELEHLHPGALQRQLRDRRFDSTIQRALQDGTTLSPEFIDKAVDAYHRRYLAYRAKTIARTEAVGAANNGQAASAAALEHAHPDFEIEKEWISTQDDKTRHDHWELHGQVVRGLDVPFVCDSGDEIRWPHDPAAPARQVINCRCTWVTRLVPRLVDGSSEGEQL